MSGKSCLSLTYILSLAFKCLLETNKLRDFTDLKTSSVIHCSFSIPLFKVSKIKRNSRKHIGGIRYSITATSKMLIHKKRASHSKSNIL